MAPDSRGLRRRSAAALLLAMLLAPAARAAAPLGKARRASADEAVEVVFDGKRIFLMSADELAAREEAARKLAEAEAAKARALAPLPPAADDEQAPAGRRRAAAARPKRRRGGPGYRQERIAGDTYRQKYSSWSCSAASLTIAASLLGRRPANETTEELVIKKLGNNISKKDGLTGRGMDALADVAQQDFAMASRRISSPEDVANEVKAGHVVLLSVRRPVSGSGHYVVVSGQGRKDGTLHIKDPAPDGGDFEWDRNTLKAAIRAGGVAVWKQ